MDASVLAPLFLAYVLVVGMAAAFILARCVPQLAPSSSVGVLAAWLLYAGALGYFGVAADYASVPPGLFRLLLPVLALVLIVSLWSKAGRSIATHVPLWLLIGFQAFRIGVEATLHELWRSGLAPKLLTLEGGNVEIIVALTAPLVAWLVIRGVAGRRLVLAWNVVGLLSLLNVVVRAVLSAPGPINVIHAEVPNLAIGLFPFTFIPGFMAPLALMVHLLTLRKLRLR